MRKFENGKQMITNPLRGAKQDVLTSNARAQHMPKLQRMRKISTVGSVIPHGVPQNKVRERPMDFLDPSRHNLYNLLYNLLKVTYVGYLAMLLYTTTLSIMFGKVNQTQSHTCVCILALQNPPKKNCQLGEEVDMFNMLCIFRHLEHKTSKRPESELCSALSRLPMSGSKSNAPGMPKGASRERHQTKKETMSFL